MSLKRCEYGHCENTFQVYGQRKYCEDCLPKVHAEHMSNYWARTHPRVMKPCKRVGCEIVFTPDHPRTAYCSDECRLIVRKETERRHNERTQAKRHEISQGRGVGQRGKDKGPRKTRETEPHPPRWYELRRVLEKHGLI